MGLFSAIGNFVNNVKTEFQKRSILDGNVNAITNIAMSALSNPLKFVTNTSGAVSQVATQSVAKTAVQGAVSTATIASLPKLITSGTSYLATGLSGGAGVAGFAKSAGIVTIAVPAVASAVKSNPQIISSVPDVVTNSASASYDLGDFVSNPSLEKAEQYVKTHPIALVVALLSAGLLTGKALTLMSSAYNNYKSRQAVEELAKNQSQDKPITNSTGTTNNFISDSNPTQGGGIVQNFYAIQPATSETANAPASEQSEKPSKTAKKKATTKKKAKPKAKPKKKKKAKAKPKKKKK